MSDIPAAAIAAAIDATDAYAREHLVVVSQVGYRRGVMDAALTAAAPLIDAAARASERERIRQQLLDVITANVASGNDTVYGALLDAIRELGAP